MMTGPRVFGMRWRKMMRAWERPRLRAASMSMVGTSRSVRQWDVMNSPGERKVVTCVPPVEEGAGAAPSVEKVPGLLARRLRGLVRSGRGSVHGVIGHVTITRVVHRLPYRYVRGVCLYL
jgi:hypothetical protein